MNCERHAASTELCLTKKKEKKKRRRKTKKKKKEEERIARKATDTNQQLYHKNYHSGLKDKYSETKKRKNGEKHDTKKTYK